VITTLLGMPLCIAAYFVPNAILALLLLGSGTMIFGSFAAGSFSTLQILTPPRMRGKLSAAYIFSSGLISTALGPISVAFVTDKILRDETRLGTAVAIVILVVGSLGAAVLHLGRGPLRDGVREGYGAT